MKHVNSRYLDSLPDPRAIVSTWTSAPPLQFLLLGVLNGPAATKAEYSSTLEDSVEALRWRSVHLDTLLFRTIEVYANLRELVRSGIASDDPILTGFSKVCYQYVQNVLHAVHSLEIHDGHNLDDDYHFAVVISIYDENGAVA